MAREIDRGVEGVAAGGEAEAPVGPRDISIMTSPIETMRFFWSFMKFFRREWRGHLKEAALYGNSRLKKYMALPPYLNPLLEEGV